MGNEDVRKQVIAVGFAENSESAAAVVDRLEKLLQQLLGDGAPATVAAGSNTIIMGLSKRSGKSRVL
eukprot:7403771-Pyramimonas_sp.AAC.1